MLLRVTRCALCCRENIPKRYRVKCCLEKPLNICKNCVNRSLTRCPSCNNLFRPEQIGQYSKWETVIDIFQEYKGHILAVILTLFSIGVPYLHLVVGMGPKFAQEHLWVKWFLFASGGLVFLDVLCALMIYGCIRENYRGSYTIFKVNVLHLLKIVVTLLLAIPKISISFFSQQVKAIIFVTILGLTFLLLTIYSVIFCVNCIIYWLRHRDLSTTNPYGLQRKNSVWHEFGYSRNSGDL